MGNYLEKPLTDKTTFAGITGADGGTDGDVRNEADQRQSNGHYGVPLRFAVSTMQGRRTTQEDAHVVETKLRTYREETEEWEDPLPGHSLFAVFDGHGTEFAAKYASLHFVATLCQQAAFIEYSETYLARMGNGRSNTCNGSKRSKKKKKKGQTKGTETRRKDTEEMTSNLLKDALINSFLELDADLLREMTRRKENRDLVGAAYSLGPADVENLFDEFDSGTTAIVVLVTPQIIISANLGDSRAILVRQNDVCSVGYVRLSADHKPDVEQESIRIRNAGGVVCSGKVGGRLAVSRALGDFFFKDMDSVLCVARDGSIYNNPKVVRPEDQMVSPVPDIVIVERDIDRDKFLLMACDGIWDVSSNEDTANMIETIFLEGESNIGLICEEILDTCCLQGSLDNMTAILIQFPAQEIGVGGGVMKRRKTRERAKHQ